MFIDLFAGAGGLGLGFEWAGWLPVVASDIDKNALETHSRNLDCPVVLGDITDEEIKRRIVEYASEARKVHPEMPLIVLGGRPVKVSLPLMHAVLRTTSETGFLGNTQTS